MRQREPFLRSRSPKNPWLPSSALPPQQQPTPVLTEAEKQEQEAVGGGPEGPQGGWSTLQGHGLWRTATLMSPPLTHPQPVKGSQSPWGSRWNLSGPCSSVWAASGPTLGTKQSPGPPGPPLSEKRAPPARGVGSESTLPPAVTLPPGAGKLAHPLSLQCRAGRRRQGRLWLRLASVSPFAPGELSSSGLGVLLTTPSTWGMAICPLHTLPHPQPQVLGFVQTQGPDRWTRLVVSLLKSLSKQRPGWVPKGDATSHLPAPWVGQ